MVLSPYLYLYSFSFSVCVCVSDTSYKRSAMKGKNWCGIYRIELLLLLLLLLSF